MGRTSDRRRPGCGRAMRWAGIPVAATLLVSCVAVAIPVPIVTGPAAAVGPVNVGTWLDGTHARTARYDSARISAAEAEAFVRQDCADDGLTLDTLKNELPARGTLSRETPEAGTPGQATIAYRCH